MEHRRGLFFMLFLMVNFLAVNIGIGIVLRNNFELTASPWFAIFYSVMIMLFPLGIWLAFFKENINMHLPHIRLGTTNTIYIVGLSLAMLPVMWLISAVTTIFIPNAVSEYLLERMHYPLWLMLLSGAVTPAICEEVVFRGYIQSSFKEKPFITMALLNGLFFAVIHFHWSQFLYAFAAGIIFAYMVHITRSIRSAVIAHFILNAANISITWLSVNMSEDFAAELEKVEAMDSYDLQMMITRVVIIVMGLGASVYMGVILYFFRKHNLKRFAAQDTLVQKSLSPLDGVLILAIVSLYVIVVNRIR
jgi:hypothetical protein